MQKFKAKIGLEVHVQLSTKTKMFCRCMADNGLQDPNKLVCPICLALPGSLPMLNKRAVELAVICAHALQAEVQKNSRFDRKNYFYPDSPKGYQISQYFFPIALNGKIITKDNGVVKEIRINRIHLEEDTAKLIHAGKVSLIDFNRAGIPLMEIVSEPDIETPKMAADYLRNLREILVWNKISTARMQLGEMRCDANISLLDADGNQISEVVEIKNMNSFKNVEKALVFEHKRQIECFINGEKIIKETRGFNAQENITISQRTKEFAHDYRYYPEPDVMTIILDNKFIDGLESLNYQEYVSKLSNDYQIKDKELVERLIKGFEEIKRSFELYYPLLESSSDTNRLGGELAKLFLEVFEPKYTICLKERAKDDDYYINFRKYLAKPDVVIINLIKYYLDKKITKVQFVDILDKILNNAKEVVDLEGYIDKLNVFSVGDYAELFRQFKDENPEQVVSFRSKEEKQNAVINFFIGYVKRKLNGGGNVDEIKKVFLDEINRM